MTEETKTQETADTTQLSLNDLANMKTIIDIASSRGAFKPGEMTVIGQTYNKLVTFLEGATKQQSQGDTK
jgi:hypothetical protein